MRLHKVTCISSSNRKARDTDPSTFPEHNYVCSSGQLTIHLMTLQGFWARTCERFRRRVTIFATEYTSWPNRQGHTRDCLSPRFHWSERVAQDLSATGLSFSHFQLCRRSQSPDKSYNIAVGRPKCLSCGTWSKSGQPTLLGTIQRGQTEAMTIRSHALICGSANSCVACKCFKPKSKNIGIWANSCLLFCFKFF